MTKSELVAELSARNPNMHVAELERVVNVIFESITQALEEGDRVELRGFGAFSVRERPARTGRNPRTGETVEVDGKRVPFFKTGKDLRDRVNKGRK